MLHGEQIDDFSPERKEVYEQFSSYFENPIMTKVNDNEKFSTYAAKLHCLLSKECRYLIAIMYRTVEPIGTQSRLNDIEWISFQTRTFYDSSIFNISNSHSFIVNPLHEFSRSIIQRKEVTKEASSYQALNLPIVVTLLHTKNKTCDSYQKKGTVMLALETFETVITHNVIC